MSLVRVISFAEARLASSGPLYYHLRIAGERLRCANRRNIHGASQKKPHGTHRYIRTSHGQRDLWWTHSGLAKEEDAQPSLLTSQEIDRDESEVECSSDECHTFSESFTGQPDSQDLASLSQWAEFEDTSNADNSLSSNDAPVDIRLRPEDQTSKPESLTLRSRMNTLREEVGFTYKDLVRQSLLRREPETLMKAMIVASDDSVFIKSIPDNTFAEIIALIQPKKFLSRISSVHVDISPGLAEQMNVTSVDELISDYLRMMVDILGKQRSVGKHLNITDYELLLSITDWTGSKALAGRLWALMTKVDHITPNVVCYNHYLAAIVNNERHNAKARHHQRITPFATAARSKSKLGASFVAYRHGEGGIKEVIMSKYGEMVNQKISLNETTYCIIILGVARGGGLDMVKSVLKRIWSIDVNDLMSETPKSTAQHSGAPIARDSPLYPTGALLHAIAHAFSINNDIPAALRVVDCFSHTYNIPIPLHVWKELFAFTFVLSVPRTKSKKVGQLPKQGLLRMWDTMVNEPYNVRPTLAMYDQLIKGLFYMQRVPDMWKYIQEACEKADNAAKNAERANARLELATHEASIGSFRNCSTEKLEREVQYHNLLLKRIYYWKQRWLRLLLASMRSWQKVDRDLHWSTVVMPTIILEMQQFESRRDIFYDIPGGQVRLAMRK